MITSYAFHKKTKNIVTQLTHSASGHTIHHNGVFSKDGKWIVFDGRNDDTKIGETSTIGLLNINTKEEKIIYKTTNPTLYGPGVGAASFSPSANRVIFIHGLPNANKEKPYGFTRRTGVAIDIDHPFQPIDMDARDITYPYTPGSLRGGTHSHGWSPDGKLLSFTYNDELVDADARTVGVMFNSGKPVLVDSAAGNNNGEMYAAIVADVTIHPKPGSDEISKAFDECWVGSHGYTNSNGKHISYAIAFQGNTVNKDDKTVTEIFITDIDTAAILRDSSATGKQGERPPVPNGITQRRISVTEKGLSSVRHWLRSSKDGKLIYALAKDSNDITQLISCDVNSGTITYLTHNSFSVDYPFNLNSTGDEIAFIGNNNVYVLNLKNNKTQQLTAYKSSDSRVVGAPSFSPDGKMIVFNQYKKDSVGEFLQIMCIKL